MGIDAIVLIAILILSVVLHEVAHGYAAWKLGDPTAKLQGRLTLNPIVHIDPIGSVLVPGILVLGSTMAVGGPTFLFGWARPVPYNPYNFSDQKYGEAKVAAAGPAVNVLIALVFAAIVQFADVLGLSSSFINLAFSIIFLNLFLAIFNLLPFPPLDGSKILPILLPFELKMKYQALRNYLEHNIATAFLVVVFLMIFVLGDGLASLVFSLTQLLMGL